MKFAWLFVAALLFTTAGACAAAESSYGGIVSAIKSTMEGNTAAVRQESYDYIRFNRCTMDYRVNGTYRSGVNYSVKYSGMEFSQLNAQVSTAGEDYAAFVTLNFKTAAQYDNGTAMPVHTVEVFVSEKETAKELLGLFRRLGEVCGASR